MTVSKHFPRHRAVYMDNVASRVCRVLPLEPALSFLPLMKPNPKVAFVRVKIYAETSDGKPVLQIAF
jgi:hypothetical protein